MPAPPRALHAPTFLRSCTTVSWQSYLQLHLTCQRYSRLQEEGYPPPAEMPIKQLQFTPLKAPPASAATVSNAFAKLSDASSKDSVESAEDVEGEASSDAEVRTCFP